MSTASRDRLPPPELLPELLPEFLFEAPQLQFPPRLNCASELLDRWMAQGKGDRPCVRGHEGSWSYAELQAVATRVAHVLVEDRAKVEIEATAVVP
jgi:2-aminobenzoate-CoA ligase